MSATVTERLLALHYIYPKPFNRIASLLTEDPDLMYLQRRPARELAHCLRIPQEQAALLKTLYSESLQRPYLQLYEKHSIIPIPIYHPDYPESLTELIDPPAVLYCKGNPAFLRDPKRIAIVGSRKATEYSLTAIERLVPALAEHGYTVISGLAKGADAMAHAAAIRAGGRTIAVTGSGFSHPYPKENQTLQHIMEETQLVITEYPPYMTPKRWNFPLRNRIISGLSKGIAVTEAELKSGTLSTIEHGLEHGKDIFAVPGPIHSKLSEGPNQLIAEGAKPVWNGLQILEEYEELGPV
ncbi:DNA-processing protein DprA [Planococcus lenghuensis]|uniref:DNA protecting protein DprA n=1 Tax=Planococcus lenghuensis TaxID=2213202 RepID=A0A1Q2KZW4_9BACL|nr:DNA-processing protein DprA [Planococcus lenghuensis]AQQ53739.1 DNA protecting protein DprA [Planococcus lenghuensis]